MCSWISTQPHWTFSSPVANILHVCVSDSGDMNTVLVCEGGKRPSWFEVTVATWHFTSDEHWVRQTRWQRLQEQGELKPNYRRGIVTKQHTMPTGWRLNVWLGYSIPVKNNKPFSLVAPCKDRFHPGPLRISEKICQAHTYPTLSLLGNTSSNDIWSDIKYVGESELALSVGIVSSWSGPGWTSAAVAAGRQSCVLIGPKFVTRSYLVCGACVQPDSSRLLSSLTIHLWSNSFTHRLSQTDIKVPEADKLRLGM